MVQREVADRFFAPPSTKAYGAVSVLVQLAARKTGFHPVARTVFRPPPNVDSALVAFRRLPLPAGFAERQAGRRGVVRAPAQDAAELTRARRARQPAAGSRGARGDRARGQRACRGARAGRVRRPGRCVVTSDGARRAPASAKLNLALVVGPRRADGKHEVATVLQRLDLGDRVAISAAPRLTVDRLRGRHARPRALEALATAAGVEPRWGAVITKRIPVAAGLGGGSSDAATALRLANLTLDRAAAADRAPPARGGARRRCPVLPDVRARSSAAATAPSSRRSSSRRTTGSLLVLPHGALKESTAAVYRCFDERGRGERLGRPPAALDAALAGATRARATSPRCRRTTSPRRRSPPSSCGSARSAPTSRAPAPTVYGLFLHRRHAERRAARARRRRPNLADGAHVVRLTAGARVRPVRRASHATIEHGHSRLGLCCRDTGFGSRSAIAVVEGLLVVFGGDSRGGSSLARRRCIASASTSLVGREATTGRRPRSELDRRGVAACSRAGARSSLSS